MGELKVNVKDPYKVYFGKVEDRAKDVFKPINKGVIIADENTKQYIPYLKEKTKRKDFYEVTIRSGERAKSFGNVEKIIEKLIEFDIKGNDTLIALGGGMITDITAFIAGVYLRGLEYISVPTSLLAMVDASIGGKCAVNLKGGKNMAGLFYQPKAVCIDSYFLKTLKNKNVKDGVSEIVKYAMIKDADLAYYLSLLELKKTNVKLPGIINKCCEYKVEIIEKDVKDQNIRRALNFGHTVGHALEKARDYKISHGAAVAFGMEMESKMALELKLIEKETHEKLMEIITKNKLYRERRTNIQELMPYIKVDKKTTKNKITFIYTPEVGQFAMKEITLKEFERVLNAVLSKN